jgi:uncharacterized protein (DUF305 family)
MKRLLLVALLFLLTGCGTWFTETTGAVAPPQPLDGSFNGTDVMFLQMAVPQHEQGIELAKLAEKRASRKEVRELATAIRVTQEDEVARMKRWLTKWRQPIAPDLDPAAHGGHGGMHGTDPAMLEMLRNTPKGRDFDARFLNVLTAHQHGAVELARMEQRDGFNPDTRALADTIVKSRSAEIQQIGAYL